MADFVQPLPRTFSMDRGPVLPTPVVQNRMGAMRANEMDAIAAGYSNFGPQRLSHEQVFGFLPKHAEFALTLGDSAKKTRHEQQQKRRSNMHRRN